MVEEIQQQIDAAMAAGDVWLAEFYRGILELAQQAARAPRAEPTTYTPAERAAAAEMYGRHLQRLQELARDV